MGVFIRSMGSPDWEDMKNMCGKVLRKVAKLYEKKIVKMQKKLKK
jgi:hypothetical protein